MKKIVGYSSLGIALVVLIGTVIAAASIGREASALDTMLKAAAQNHEPAASVVKKAEELGMHVTGTSGRGPDHWAVIYRTWLTLQLSTSPDGLTTGYHLDREGAVF